MSSDINIYRILDNDFDKIDDLYKLAIKESAESFLGNYQNFFLSGETALKKHLKTNRCYIFLAEKDGEPIGMNYSIIRETQFDTSTAFIFGLYVKLNFRRQKCAKNLLDITIKHIEATPHITNSALIVNKKNKGAIKLFSNYGFDIMTYRTALIDATGKSHDGWIMERPCTSKESLISYYA